MLYNRQAIAKELGNELLFQQSTLQTWGLLPLFQNRELWSTLLRLIIEQNLQRVRKEEWNEIRAIRMLREKWALKLTKMRLGGWQWLQTRTSWTKIDLRCFPRIRVRQLIREVHKCLMWGRVRISKLNDSEELLPSRMPTQKINDQTLFNSYRISRSSRTLNLSKLQKSGVKKHDIELFCESEHLSLSNFLGQIPSLEIRYLPFSNLSICLSTPLS